MIKVRDLKFEYFDRDEDGTLTEMINAIKGINFDVNSSEIIAITGRNGSGKSTFAKILNRLLVPIEGTVFVDEWNALDPDNVMEIRKKVGMVFQNPEDQLIGSIVAEEIAFGAENIGISQSRIWENVKYAIFHVGLANEENIAKVAAKRLDKLSGGEKQKVAIAGILAMEPKYIVFDEATSMLDNNSRNEIMKVAKSLKEKHGITSIFITHLMDEVMMADKVCVFDRGVMAYKGTPADLFADTERLNKYGMAEPPIVRLIKMLNHFGIDRNYKTGFKGMTDVEDITDALMKKYPYAFETVKNGINVFPQAKKIKNKFELTNAIIFDNVSFSYNRKSGRIFDNVNMIIGKGEYVAITGDSGAGKSTMLQLIMGFERPDNGNIFVDGFDLWDRATDVRAIRCKIGYLFQYPEKQLFARNVFEDVVFGPRNLGISEVEAEKRAYEAIELVGLSQDVYDLPIDKLSGGQKRRVALAGVLAMKPEYLLLDEPTAGLDPEGKEKMLEIIDVLHREIGITIVMVSHDACETAKYAERVIYLDGENGMVEGNADYVFYSVFMENVKKLISEDFDVAVDSCINKLALPEITKLMIKLRSKGLPVECQIVDEEKGVMEIKRQLERYV